MDAVLGRCDRDISPGDDERIIDVDAMLISRRNRQTAAAVDGQIIMGKDRAAGIVRQRLLGVGGPAGERVLRILRQGQEDLVRLIDPQAGVIGAANRHAVQPDPDLGGIMGVHDDLSILQGTGEYVPPAI